MAKSPASASITVPPEGGFVALVGYLNQMLGGAQDFVECIVPKQNTSDGFQTLLKFEHEVYQQDFARIDVDKAGFRRRTLTQYKFSLNPDSKPIRPKEFREIHTALLASKQQADAVEVLQTDLILRTNRPLSARSKAGSSAAAERAAIRYELFDPMQSLDAVGLYANRFGLFEGSEISDAVNRVINLLFMAAASQASKQIRRDQFDAALCGFATPRSLVAGELAPYLFDELERQRQTILGVNPSITFALRESVSKALGDSVDDAIVVFTGNGGYGKSVAIWQLLKLVGTPRAAFPKLTYLIRSGSAKATLGGIVSRWRVATGITTTTDADDVALARVEHANPGLPPPFVYLGLDGVDEVPYSEEWRETISRLVNLFWQIHQKYKDSGEIPPARLIVSCRRKQDIEQFMEGSSGLGVAGKVPFYVRISEFSTEEFRDVCNSAKIDATAKSRLLEASSLSRKNDTFAPVGGSELVHTGVDLVVRERIALLKHPVVWQCFCLLGPEEQKAFLSQNDAALRSLSEKYIAWFLNRAQSRRNFDRDETWNVLQAVSRNCIDEEEVYELRQWAAAASATSGWSETAIKRLYRESLSAGLVDDIPAPSGNSVVGISRWRWRHSVLVRYLRDGTNCPTL